MELTSENDYKLLRNIVCIKKIIVESRHHNKEELDIYNTIIHLLNSGNTQEVNNIFSTPSSNLGFAEFKQNITSKSNKEIAEEYINIVKSIGFSDEKFHEFLLVFFKDNENLNPYYHSTDYPTDLTELYLKNLNKLLKRNTQKNNPQLFKDFSSSYATNVKKLAKEIYKKYLKSCNKTLTDIVIRSSKNQHGIPSYVTDLTYSDNETNEFGNLKLEENAPSSGFASTYYQNLCRAYIESYDCSTTDENLITQELISSKTNNFRKYFEIIKTMINRNISIKYGRLIFSDETNIEPEEQILTEQPENNVLEYEI